MRDTITLHVGDRVRRYDSGDTATVTQDEEGGFVEVQYDNEPGVINLPIHQHAAKFRKIIS